LGEELLLARDTTEQHLLKMMRIHDFEKIILCVNEFKSFGEVGIVEEHQQLEKINAFLELIFMVVPEYICNLLRKHIDNLKRENKECQ
jgi:hypothetical protein